MLPVDNIENLKLICHTQFAMMSPTRTALCCLVIFLYIVASKCNNGDGYAAAPNCARNDCPAYTVVHTEKEFEIRSYKDAQWLSVPNIPSNSYNISAASKGFLTLLGYLYGENDKKLNINITSPILVGVENSTYTVYFYLPEKYQQKRPQPLRDEIKAVKLPGHKYAAVRRIDDVLSDESVPIHVDALKKSLESSPNYQRAATGDAFMVAAYSSPFELINRVNEIIFWFD